MPSESLKVAIDERCQYIMYLQKEKELKIQFPEKYKIE